MIHKAVREWFCAQWNVWLWLAKVGMVPYQALPLLRFFAYNNIRTRKELKRWGEPGNEASTVHTIITVVLNRASKWQLLFSMRLESYLEVTDYNAALIKQLGLGRQNPSSRNHCQESSEEVNVDVHAGSRLAPQSSLQPLNFISSSPSLQKLLVHKVNYSSQESKSVLQVTELTANHKLETIWKQVSEWLDKLCLCSQVCSSIRKSACRVLQCFSSFMPPINSTTHL